jgi:hypothetical protein
MKRPTLIRPDSMGMGRAQLECISKLEEALESAKEGQILALVLVAVGPDDFGIAIAGADAPRLNLGLDAAKTEIMSRVLGPKRSVIHR